VSERLPGDALNQLFREARTHSMWLDEPVTDAEIAAIYELAKMGPTSANQSPARFIWCRTPEAKERLAATASEGNKAKILAAPVTVIIGYDLDFHEQLPWLFPHVDARAWFVGNEDLRRESAFRNATLQGAYLILAARALGFDCGPMSGFDQDAATAAFFADQPRVRADWIVSIGHGDHAALHGRLPRPEFAIFNRMV
jgi:3-hydroxypropanoate dehydrogenase